MKVTELKKNPIIIYVKYCVTYLYYNYIIKRTHIK